MYQTLSTFISYFLSTCIVCLASSSAWADTKQTPQNLSGLASQTAQTFGWVEEVLLEPGRRWKINAKLDSGADTSSLDATNIRRVKAGGKSYVRFTVKNPDTGKPVSMRQPYVRTVKIRKHNGKHERRRVVLMTMCLGNQERTIEVTLTDRVHFDYAMLIGRSALSGLAIIDPQKKHTREPMCWSDNDGVDDQESAATSIAVDTLAINNK